MHIHTSNYIKVSKKNIGNIYENITNNKVNFENYFFIKLEIKHREIDRNIF